MQGQQKSLDTKLGKFHLTLKMLKLKEFNHLAKKVEEARKELVVVQENYDKDPFNAELRELKINIRKQCIFLDESKKSFIN